MDAYTVKYLKNNTTLKKNEIKPTCDMDYCDYEILKKLINARINQL